MRARTSIGLVVAVLSVFAFAPSPLLAQKPVSAAAMVNETFTIEAIDSARRTVTLKDKDGVLTDVVCGPEVQRFDALKVGDKVNFRYYESMVLAIRKPGSGPAPAGSSGIVRAPDQL